VSGGRTIALQELIGQGSVSSVYAGVVEGARGGHRRVAVKVFDRLPEEAKDNVLKSLSRAVTVATCVSDPRVVHLFDYDLSRRNPFLVTELVDGGALETLIAAFARQGLPFPQDLAILICLKVAEGLSAAHAARLPDGRRADVVHGNVSARDVLVSWSGEVKIGDFGLATATAAVSMMRAIDTPTHLAPTPPEVAWGHPADARSDVFSLGMLLRRMLVGHRFAPHTPPLEAVRLVRAGAVHTSLAEHQLIAPLRAVLKRSTEPDPRWRYPNAGELAGALRGVAQLLGVPDVPAYIAHAIEDAFTPEIVAKHVAAHELEPPPPECVAELVPGYERYAEIVEISNAPRKVTRERPRTPPGRQVKEPSSTLVLPPKAELAKREPARKRDATKIGAAPAPKKGQKPAVPRPTPRARQVDSAPTIICAKPRFED
jgi:serine/threonine-protein kinase